MTSKKSNYLKYWKLIKRYVKLRYNLTEPKLDMLLFLYSESYFTLKKIKEFNKIGFYGINMFNELREDGWIEEAKKGYNGRIVFNLSNKAIRTISKVYNILDGVVLMRTRPESNPMLNDTNKNRYEAMIAEMNEFIQQQQRHAP
jgi:hypothetical protein